MDKMNDADIVKAIKALGILFLFLLGMASGADYSDNNWKHDIIKVSDNNSILSFKQNNDYYYFNVTSINIYAYKHNYTNYQEFNVTNDSKLK